MLKTTKEICSEVGISVDQFKFLKRTRSGLFQPERIVGACVALWNPKIVFTIRRLLDERVKRRIANAAKRATKESRTVMKKSTVVKKFMCFLNKRNK